MGNRWQWQVRWQVRWQVVMVILAVMASAAVADDFEVWLVDQSNSFGKSYGGTIYIYDGHDLMGQAASKARPTAVVDLGGEVAQLCFDTTGARPVRPHMVVFNSTDSHATLAFVASGHVVFFDARTLAPLACLRMQAGAGGARQAHAVWPTSDDRFMLVANQNGKLFERIRTDYATNSFVYEPAAALDLANCLTPNGQPCQAAGVRPDNAPICPFVSSAGSPAYVTLRGGGLLAVNPTATPMSIVAEYDRSAIGGNGCGLIEARGWVYLNAGGGTASNLERFAVYRLPVGGYSPLNPPNSPAAQLLYEDNHGRDAHGVAVSRDGRWVWMYDRLGNRAEVFDAESGVHAGTVSLEGPLSADPSPDLVAPSPSGNRHFVSLRGPNPLSGDPHASSGATPGLGVVQITEGGRDGYLKAIVRISNVDGAGVERADAHGIRLRRKR